MSWSNVTTELVAAGGNWLQSTPAAVSREAARPAASINRVFIEYLRG
jgi:hypothetical protein